MTETLIALPGSTPPNDHQLLGRADDNTRLEVTVKLRRKSEEGLPTLDEFIAGKRAVGVTRDVLAERYGASKEDAAAVQQWAVGQGLSVFQIDLGRRQMRLVGSVGAVSQAFGVNMFRYRHNRTGTEFHCPDGDIHIPESLTGIITGVFGLNNMPVVIRQPVTCLAATATSTDPKTRFPGSFYPNEVAALYNFPPTPGDGQRVAILEFGGGFDPAVLASYFTGNIGLAASPIVNAINVLGATQNLGDPATGEVYLDIEVVGAMAPKATIDVYFAPWSGEGYLNAIDQAVHNDDYAAISISYGLDEDIRGSAANPGWPMLHANIDESFKDAAAVGVPLFVSSGDQGSSSMRGQVNGNEVTVLAPAAHAGYPASSPYATAVGGTMLYAQNGAITQEVVWNELGALQEGKYYLGGATGGGVSDRYPTAPSYQTGAGINLKSVNTHPVAGRCIPDVAGNSGATTGYLVSQPPGSPVAVAPVGGTSAAAPMWAALMACVRQALGPAFTGGVPSFFLNDFIYAHGATAAFRDIVDGRQITYDANGAFVPGEFIPVGNNKSSKADGYYAKAGYDLCTGWGSPNGVELVKQLQAWLLARPPAASS